MPWGVVICKWFKAHRGSAIECEKRGVIRPAECKWIFGAAKCDQFDAIVVPRKYLSQILSTLKKADIICFKCKHLDASKPINPGDIYCTKKQSKVLGHKKACPYFEPMEGLNEETPRPKQEEKKGQRSLLDYI